MRFAQKLNSKQKQIHDNAISCAKKYLSAESELMAAIMEVDREKIYEKFGETHLTPYCVRYLNLTESVAGAIITVARKSIEVPELKAAIDDGLTVSKAKVIVSVLTKENQEMWIEKAQTQTRAEVGREVAQTKPPKEEPERAKLKANNKVRVEYDLSDEEMEQFRRAQNLVSAKLGRFATLAETQAFLVQSFLKREDPVEKAERAKSHSPRGESISRAIPAAVKHQVFRRDRGQCQAKKADGSKCCSTRWVQLHHVKEWSQGGQHTEENLTTLCSAHHRQHHRH